MGRTYNKTCEECGDPFVATGVRQRECDSCWGEARGAIRVEYRDNGRRRRRLAVIVCRKCDTEFSTTNTTKARPGLCQPCANREHSTRPKAESHRAKIAAANTGKRHSPESIAKMSAASMGNKSRTGIPHSPETLEKLSAAQRVAQAEAARRGAARGGKFGFVYVVAGPGQVKVGGSADADTLAQRLAQHEKNGLVDVCGTWQVDPRDGGTLEAEALAAVLSEWDQVGTTIRPDGGTETVWCDDPGAVVAVVEEIVGRYLPTA